MLRSLPAWPAVPNVGLIAELIYKEHLLILDVNTKACDEVSSDNIDMIYVLIQGVNGVQELRIQEL